MTDNIQNTIQKKLAELPESVRLAISHINYQTQVASLMHKYNLRVDQAGILDTEIMLVLLGLEHPDSLANNLAREGNLPRETTTAIMDDLNESVFKAIRHELVELYDKEQVLGQILHETGAPSATQQPPLPPRPTGVRTETQTKPAHTGTSQVPQGVAHTMPTDIAKTKLEQSFRIPPSSTTVSLGTEQKTASEGLPQKKPYSGVDPYREPVK